MHACGNNWYLLIQIECCQKMKQNYAGLGICSFALCSFSLVAFLKIGANCSFHFFECKSDLFYLKEHSSFYLLKAYQLGWKKCLCSFKFTALHARLKKAARVNCTYKKSKRAKEQFVLFCQKTSDSHEKPKAEVPTLELCGNNWYLLIQIERCQKTSRIMWQ